MLQPSRIKLFAGARRWAVQELTGKLSTEGVRGDGVLVMDKFKLAMFSLILAMCFGEKIEEEKVKEMQAIQYELLRVFVKFNPFAFFPKITKLLFKKRWEEIVATRRRQAEIFAPLIRARRVEEKRGFLSLCYVDSLINVEIPEEGGRELREDEIVNLCHEFLSGATDTTATALEWIMAELVRHQEMQRRLIEDVERVVAAGEEIKESDLQKMPYLKAVIMEGLRRHPPGHFVLPHKAREDVRLHGYLIPKGSEVHVNVAQLGWDATVWEEPMEFKPERFMEGGEYRDETVDLTGSREIKMMPFGAGRRMCLGYGLAMLHLEYIVANLVREFEWKAVDGEEVDMSEDLVFTVVMKNPLRARILQRNK